MSASLVWEGLDELRAALRALPDDLAKQGGEIVMRAAGIATNTIQMDYPEGPTGNLRAGVSMEQGKSRFGAAAIVRSRSAHASIFERGTVTRQTRKGANRGVMRQPPEAERMIPAAIRIRRQMIIELIELVRAQGFVITEANAL